MKPRQIARNVAQVPPQQAGATMEAARRDTGRICPVRYHYGADALAAAACQHVPVLYVIGGLYGNTPALDALEQMARREQIAPTLCFNGDFNWFDTDDESFAAINHAVLQHDAILGNVEAELQPGTDDAGCGCAYPEIVPQDVVDRSNLIHARLKSTAERHPEVLAQLARLPMVARYRVADTLIGVVHGDADSLAGWSFDVSALDDPANAAQIEHSFAEARVDVFASSHTCLPALRRFDRGLVINNGAAGMPNFRGMRHGLITRISSRPAPHPTLYCTRIGDVWVEAVPLAFDYDDWIMRFLANWPDGSPAYLSYFARITDSPDYSVERAAPGAPWEGRSQCGLELS